MYMYIYVYYVHTCMCMYWWICVCVYIYVSAMPYSCIHLYAYTSYIDIYVQMKIRKSYANTCMLKAHHSNYLYHCFDGLGTLTSTRSHLGVGQKLGLYRMKRIDQIESDCGFSLITTLARYGMTSFCYEDWLNTAVSNLGLGSRKPWVRASQRIVNMYNHNAYFHIIYQNYLNHI